MIPSVKVQSRHRERLACVYVRQSTVLQVRQHQESTERQYHLQERALTLGWAPTAVEVIDEDQGHSGQTAISRSGFQRLVSQVSLGQVGIVLMLEASRLARSNSDWYRLIEICGLRATLLADEQAIYDPRDPNDRLLLGVKATLSEAELMTFRTRLDAGRWNKARKGLLHFPLPVGYVEGPTGTWELDPDTQVRERLTYVFDAFRRLGVARRVLRELKARQLDLPGRVMAHEGYGALVWKTPTFSAVIRLLSNPAYAGAYVYGRWDYSGEERSGKTGKILPHPRPLADWPVCLRDHHPGYVGWEEFVANRERLRANWNREGKPGVAREGPALLQGVVYCGVCGQKMKIRNRAAQEHRSPTYLCDAAYADGEERICQSMTARSVDGAIADAFLEAVTPLSLEVSLRVLEEVERGLAVQRRQWELQLDQARYEARLAQKQYDAVDPEHRLVAAELERRWNEKLERVARLEQAYARAELETHWTLSLKERETIRTLAQDLPALWRSETTTNRERKQLLRMAVDSVQLDGVSQPGQIDIQILWRTGTITTLRVGRAKPGERSLKTPAGAVARIAELALTHTYPELAEVLKAEGWVTAFGRPFSSLHVGYVCRCHGWGRGKEHIHRQRHKPMSDAGKEIDGS
jgi:DNA invertase Pin-like site-specific DNA recombinase